jgi:hypothetical protein
MAPSATAKRSPVDRVLISSSLTVYSQFNREAWMTLIVVNWRTFGRLNGQTTELGFKSNSSSFFAAVPYRPN